MAGEFDILRIAIVGYGRVGRVLARAFVRAGHRLAGIVSRPELSDPWLDENKTHVTNDLSSLPTDLDFVLLSVRDSQIKSVGREICKRSGFRTDTTVAHTAGALSAEALDMVRECDCLPLAWHPLQTFTGDEEAQLVGGITFGIDGDPKAVELGEKLAENLGGIPLRIIPEMRPLYHLGGVFACNLMAALVGLAQDLLTESGVDRETALRSVMPLLKTTVENIDRKGLPGAITGPVSRGDVETVKRHLETLKNHPQAYDTYKILSRVLAERLDVTGIFKDLLNPLKY